MKKLIVSLVILISNWCLGVMDCNAKNEMVTSPDGAVMVTVGVKDHRPFYTVDYQGRTLVAPSHLGAYRPLDAGGIPCVQRWFRFQI